MKLFILLLLPTILTACNKSPEASLEEFYKKTFAEKDFDGAYEMLSERNQKKVTKELFAADMKRLLQVEKYSSLYDYQGKRTEFKVIKVKDGGPEAMKVRFGFKLIDISADFFSFYDDLAFENKGHNAEKLFNDEFLKKLMAEGRRSFFEEREASVVVVKEKGDWKVDLRSPKDFFKEELKFSSWFRDEERTMAEVRRKERINKTSYADLVYREIASTFGRRSAQAVTKCALVKTGDVTYGEVIKKHKAEGSQKIIKECFDKHGMDPAHYQ